MSKRVRFRTDLICLCPKHCAKAFERSLEPWSMRRAVWREIGNENIKKRLRKIMFRIHVTDSINQIFDDEMVYITKTNPITKNQKCNRFISYNWARVLRRRNAYILELVNDVCSFFLTGKSKEIYFTWKVINGISNRLAEIVDKTDSFCLPRPPAFPNGGRGSPIATEIVFILLASHENQTKSGLQSLQTEAAVHQFTSCRWNWFIIPSLQFTKIVSFCRFNFAKIKEKRDSNTDLNIQVVW